MVQRKFKLSADQGGSELKSTMFKGLSIAALGFSSMAFGRDFSKKLRGLDVRDDGELQFTSSENSSPAVDLCQDFMVSDGAVFARCKTLGGTLHTTSLNLNPYISNIHGSLVYD